MIERPSTVEDYKAVAQPFHAWLVENGSAILKPTNQYEVSRFITPEGTGIVYRNDAHRLTRWVNGAGQAFACFRGSKPWRAGERGNRKTSKRDRLIATLADRDGWRCMYCPVQLTAATATVEHVLSVTHGGTSHPANLALACEPCNRSASHLSVREKVEMALRGVADKQREERL